MPRPKQSFRGNLVLLGVLLAPAAVALLVYQITQSAAVGWVTLAVVTTLLLAGIATLVAHLHVSSQHSTWGAGYRWAMVALVGIGIVALMLAPVLLSR